MHLRYAGVHPEVRAARRRLATGTVEIHASRRAQRQRMEVLEVLQPMIARHLATHIALVNLDDSNLARVVTEDAADVVVVPRRVQITDVPPLRVRATSARQLVRLDTRHRVAGTPARRKP